MSHDATAPRAIRLGEQTVWAHVVGGPVERIVRLAWREAEPSGHDGVLPHADAGYVSFRRLDGGWEVASALVDERLVPDKRTADQLVDLLIDHVVGDDTQRNTRIRVVTATRDAIFDGEGQDGWVPSRDEPL